MAAACLLSAVPRESTPYPRSRPTGFWRSFPRGTSGC